MRMNGGRLRDRDIVVARGRQEVEGTRGCAVLVGARGVLVAAFVEPFEQCHTDHRPQEQVEDIDAAGFATGLFPSLAVIREAEQLGLNVRGRPIQLAAAALWSAMALAGTGMNPSAPKALATVGRAPCLSAG
ncbi:unnamed protein product [Ectocarpus sp. CCAP 1310/34]|nr:unnamed protein product [Ectocarpus sp. CCAP 1310/34]